MKNKRKTKIRDHHSQELLRLDVFTCTFSSDTKETEEQGFLTGLKIPAPWASGKALETIHPVRDNYKFKETVTIPGARCLYLRFDPRSSSQYDYDKVRWLPWLPSLGLAASTSALTPGFLPSTTMTRYYCFTL